MAFLFDAFMIAMVHLPLWMLVRMLRRNKLGAAVERG